MILEAKKFLGTKETARRRWSNIKMSLRLPSESHDIETYEK